MGKPVYLVELDALAWRQFMRSGVPGGNGTWINGNSRYVFNATKKYRVTCVARRSTTADGYLYAGVALFDSSGASISGIGAQWFYGAASSVVPPTAWTTYTAVFGAGTADTFPGGGVTMAPLVILNYDSAAGTMDVLELWIEEDATPGVAISEDRYMRDPAEWQLHQGNAPSGFPTLVDGTAQALTLRYSTAAYMTATSDTPPKTQYDARVRQPGLLRMELPGTTGGCITTSYGQIVLDNSDGALGDLAYYGFDGQPFKLRYGDDEAALSAFTTVMVGTMQQAVVDGKQVVIRLAGRDSLLDQPVCRGRYAGNNVLPNGLEGGPELTGQFKPFLVGSCYGVKPVCVNTSRLIYHVGDTIAGAAITNVWDAGVALTVGTNYTDQTDMETNAPAAGACRAWPAGGYVRLGSTPTGVVTCVADATETVYGTGDWWWKAIFRLVTSAGIASGEMQQAIGDSFPQPDNWSGGSWPTDQAAVGLWVNDPNTTVRQAVAKLASSVGAWVGFIHWGGSPGNVMKFGGDIFPGAVGGLIVTDAPNFDSSNLLALNGIADPGERRGVPVWAVELTYEQNSTVYTPNMAPTVSPLALNKLGLKNQSVKVIDFAVQSKNPTSQVMRRDTAFNDNATAVSREATRQLELHRYTKLWFEARASMAAVRDMAYKPRLGGYVYLSTPTLKVMWQDGVTRNAGWFLVMALELDFARNEVRMTLRQATEQGI